MQLAAIYQAQGDLDAAQASLEDAAILSDDPMRSELGLALLEARRGLFADAERRLARQLNDGFQPRDRVQVLSVQIEIAMVRGQIERALELLDEIAEVSSSLMPPMARLFTVVGQRSNLLLLLGRFDEAIAVADEVAAELQPPFKTFMNVKYTSIFRQAGDREKFRERANRNQEIADHFPGPMQSFLASESAQIAIWDGDNAAAVAHIDRANELLGQSILQVFEDNLSTSAVHVALAEL